ncbi:MAG TPA: Calvin cycle protein CP12 [Candidatus Obscuribacterales bacterium]
MTQIVETKTLEQAIQEAIEQARSACEVKGKTSGDCVVAWDIVEELQAERSHRQDIRKPKNSLQEYCDQNPDAVECLIYDV